MVTDKKTALYVIGAVKEKDEASFSGIMFACFCSPCPTNLSYCRSQTICQGVLGPSAKFAIAVNSSGICGALLISDPLDACSSLRNGLRPNETDKQVMIESVNITIHAVFVSKASGEVLKEHALGEEGECCIFPFQNETAWTVLAISFISFLVILGILIIAIFAPRHWLYSQGRNQLPKSVDTKIVEALPCFTFSSTGLGECHSEDTCAICLENYKDEEILKVLPCQHVSVSSSCKAVDSVVYSLV
ncbi:hypothetical protein GBA52_025267 [Prunus armeniaca]|nr:hypothetical protein GBA52_025267 [Prunus armeniaca]